jgi:hypothetical protein
MAKIFTTCPVSGQAIDTGIDIDEASFAKLPNVLGQAFCIHCGTEHGWTKEQAWMADGIPPNS